jgi:hypothetical protein
MYKHPNLSGLPVSYKEYEMLWQWPLGLFSQYFISFET